MILNQVDDRVLEIITILVVMMTVFACLCYAAIFRNPYVAFNPFKPPTATPMGMDVGPPPTFPPTRTPTITQTGTPTEAPTKTATPTPTTGPRYSVTKYEGWQFCGYTAFEFNVKDSRGVGKRDVTIHIWTDWGFDGYVTTDLVGDAKKIIGDEFFDSVWHIQLIENGQVVDQLDVTTTSGCKNLETVKEDDYSVWTIHWKENP